MSEPTDFPVVDVAVTLITRGGRVLAVYNPRWGAFTLPMTRRRDWHDPAVAASHHGEDWADAAARAAAEWLGRTCDPKPLLDDPGGYQQSDRDGAWKRYHFQTFQVALADDPALAPGAVVEWLTPAELLSPTRRPISPTARHLIAQLQEAKRL
jgi:hypothetical protein